MASEATPLEQAFDKLNTCIKNQQHKKALKACDEVLALAPGDEDALRCKVVAHMQLSEFQQALALLKKPPLASQPLGFEKAYCLYRLGQIDEALAVATSALSAPDSDSAAATPLLQLQAQLEYRRGRTRDCINTYDKLFQQHKADSLELKTNVLAAYVAAGLAGELPDLMAALKVKPRDSFEVAFNRACGLVAGGQVAAAEGELRLAIKLGRETLFEEDLGEEEVEDELSPLSCQLAYVLGRLGRQAEAAELYDKLIRGPQTLRDEATRALANNNAIADAPNRLEPGPQNRKYIASATRKLEALLERPGGAATQQQQQQAAGAGGGGGEEGGGGSVGSLAGLLARHTPAGSLPRFAEGVESRLGADQKMRLLLNLGLLYLLGGRADAAREVVGVLAAAPGGAAEPAVAMLSAAVSMSQGKTVDADRALEAFVASCGSGGPGSPPASASVGPTLMRAQTALEAGNPAAAQGLLAGLRDGDVAASGAVVATRVALYEQLNDTAGAEALLDSAVAHWRSRSGQEGAASALAWCLSCVIGLKLRLGKLEEAKQAFKQLQSYGVSTTAAGASTLVHLTRACALADPAAAPGLVTGMAPAPAPAALSRLDLDALEEGAVRAPGGGGGGGARGGPDLAAGDLAAAARAAGKRGGEAMDVDQQPRVKKSRKKRKPKLPAGYNPELPNGGLPPPDPERWLPKWERAEFKKKRDKRKREKDAVKGSQGAGKVDESLDRTKAPAPSAAGPSDAKAQPAKPNLPPRKGKGKK
ncbi:Signal recognition particle core component [Pleodorina starrii]|nr:Signal recognition particle core component [Pleodorina starrii]